MNANLINTKTVFDVSYKLIKDRVELYKKNGGKLNKEKEDLLDMCIPHILNGEATIDDVKNNFLTLLGFTILIKWRAGLRMRLLGLMPI